MAFTVVAWYMKDGKPESQVIPRKWHTGHAFSACWETMRKRADYYFWKTEAGAQANFPNPRDRRDYQLIGAKAVDVSTLRFQYFIDLPEEFEERLRNLQVSWCVDKLLEIEGRLRSLDHEVSSRDF